MAEYIERDAAYEKCGWYNTVNGKSVYAVRKDELAAIPAADVEPVRHGRWDDYHFVKTDCPKNGFPSVKCSVCEIIFCDLINNHRFMYHYCPYCGARMDLEVSE